VWLLLTTSFLEDLTLAQNEDSPALSLAPSSFDVSLDEGDDAVEMTLTMQNPESYSISVTFELASTTYISTITEYYNNMMSGGSDDGMTNVDGSYRRLEKIDKPARLPLKNIFGFRQPGVAGSIHSSKSSNGRKSSRSGDFAPSARMTSEAEESVPSWLQLLSEGGWQVAKEALQGSSYGVDAGGSSALTFRFGGIDTPAGTYHAQLNAEWQGDDKSGSQSVEFSFRVEPRVNGSVYPDSEASEGFSLTETGWEGAVGVGGTIYQSIMLSNTGTLPLLYAVDGITGHDEEDPTWQVMTSDGGSNGTISFMSGTSVEVMCTPGAVGNYTKTVVIYTNIDLPANESGSLNGNTYKFSFTCSGEPLPLLSITPSSGVKLSSGGTPIIVAGAAPAEWNNYWTSTSVTASLTILEEESGCSALDLDLTGKVVAVEMTDECSLAVQARNLAAAGAVGQLASNSNDTVFNTTWGDPIMIARAGSGSMPTIPTFVVPWAAASVAFDLISQGESVDATLTWNPLLEGVPEEYTTVSFEVQSEDESPFNYSVRFMPGFDDVTMDDFYSSSVTASASLTSSDSLKAVEVDSPEEAHQFDLTFTFPFYWARSQTISIYPTGVICVDVENCDPWAPLNESNSMITPAYKFGEAELLDGSLFTGEISHDGTKYFVAQWKNVKMGVWETSTNESMSCEVRLYEDGAIEFLYKDFSSGITANFFEAGWMYGDTVFIAEPDSLPVPNATATGGLIRFEPWLPYAYASTGAVAPGESATIKVDLEAGTTMGGLVGVAFFYDGDLAVKWEVLPLIWPAADVCQYACSSSDPCVAGTRKQGGTCSNIATSATCLSRFCESNYLAGDDHTCGYNQTLCAAKTTTTLEEGATSTSTTTTTLYLSPAKKRVSVPGATTLYPLSASVLEAGGITNAVAEGVAKTVNVQPGQVRITGIESFSDSGRRLAEGYRFKYTITFEMDADDDDGSDAAKNAHAILQDLADSHDGNSSTLFAKIVEAIEEQGLDVDTSTLTVVPEEPEEVTSMEVAWAAGSFGETCYADDPEDSECGKDFVGFQNRTVWCGEVSTTPPTEVDASHCASIDPPAANQTCTDRTDDCPNAIANGSALFGLSISIRWASLFAFVFWRLLLA